MIVQEMAHQDFGPVEGRFAGGGRRLLLVLVAKEEEARVAAPMRMQEDAAMEAEDVLSQADEALVMG